MEVIQQEVGLEGKELCKNIFKWIKTQVHQPMPADWEVGGLFLDHEIQMAQNVGWEDRNAKNSLLAVTRGWLSWAVFLAVKCRLSQVCTWIPSFPSLPPSPPPFLFSSLPPSLFYFFIPPLCLVFPFLLLSPLPPPKFSFFHTTVELLDLESA